MKFQACSIVAIFVVLFGGFAVGSHGENECQDKIPLSNETRTFNLTKNANDICLEVSPPKGDEFNAALIKSDGLSLQMDGDHELAPPTPDKQQCIILTFSKECKVWQDKLKYICEAEATVIVIHGPTTVQLRARANSNSAEDHVNSTASISYLPVGKFDGVLYDCNDVEAPTPVPTEETTKPTTVTPESQPTQSSLPTPVSETTAPNDKVQPPPRSPTPHPRVPESTKDSGNKEDDNKSGLAVVEILLIVFIAVLALIFITLCLVKLMRHRRRKSGENSSVDGRNPKDVENGGDSGHVLLNGNESASSIPPGESQEMHPVIP